jgi:arginase family enzyme
MEDEYADGVACATTSLDQIDVQSHRVAYGKLRLQLLDLDEGIRSQPIWGDTPWHDLRRLGPRIRMACRFARFRRFERALARRLGPTNEPALTFFGSGDFHHVSLALVRRITKPCNLLVLDLHPDWMRGIPILHCGTWVRHALRHPHVHNVFALGGDLDFDNTYRWLAPWADLSSGRVTVWPAVRQFERGNWHGISHEPLRESGTTLSAERLRELLMPHTETLAARPLYMSLDKDVLRAADATVNWESGYLSLSEVLLILSAFIEAAGGRLAGMDVTGDWSPVEVNGPLQRYLHWTEHPQNDVDPYDAAIRNANTNSRLLGHLRNIGIQIVNT